MTATLPFGQRAGAATRSVVGGRTLCVPGTWKGAHAFAYQWLRGGKPIANATGARYLVSAADAGRGLACRVTATATDGE